MATHTRCPICQEDLPERAENDAELPACHTLECGHRYHTGCIVPWFRSGQNTCPMCRGEPRVKFGYLDTMTRCSMLRRMARRKNAPDRLKRKVAKIRQKEEEAREYAKTKRVFLQTTCGDLNPSTTVSELISQSKRHRRTMWTKRVRIGRLKRELGMMDFSEEGFQIPRDMTAPRPMPVDRVSARRVRW